MNTFKKINILFYNLNTKDFPPDLKNIATSIYRETQQKVDFREFLHLLIENLNLCVIDFAEKGFSPFKEKIEKKLLWKGKRILINNNRCGKILGIDSQGNLIVKDCYGKILKFTSAEISIRPFPKQK